MAKIIFRPQPSQTAQPTPPPTPEPYRLLVEKLNSDPEDFMAKVQFLNQPPDNEDELMLVVLVDGGQTYLELCSLTECRGSYPDYSSEWMENMDERTNPTYIQVGWDGDIFLPCEVTFIGF